MDCANAPYLPLCPSAGPGFRWHLYGVGRLSAKLWGFEHSRRACGSALNGD